MRKGFTLIELIAVIVIIVILAAVALPRIGNMRAAANQAVIEEPAAVLQSSLERAMVEGVITPATTPDQILGILLYSNSPVSGVPYVGSLSGLTTISINPTSSYPGYVIEVIKH